jgi:hypothetical protein
MVVKDPVIRGKLDIMIIKETVIELVATLLIKAIE